MSSDFRQGMIVGALLVGIVLAVFVAAHAQLSLSVFGASKHSKSGYCEVNPGLALNYDLGRDTRLITGFYRNSLCRETKLAGVVWCGLRLGQMCFGMGLVGLTGYLKQTIFIPLPTASYEGKGYAIDFVGGTDGKQSVIGMGLRFPW